jgi:hypothetical protein
MLELINQPGGIPMRTETELKLVLDQYDLDHAKEGGLAGVALKLFKEAGPQGLIASDIVEQLFSELPLAERAALGDILDRDLTGGGGRWLRALVTGRNIVYALTTEP